MVHERAKAHGDEDGINQVGEHDGESSRQPVQLAREPRRHQGSAGGQTRIVISGLTGFASKSESQSRRAVACERV